MGEMGELTQGRGEFELVLAGRKVLPRPPETVCYR
jgi:hypothetical protein